MSERGEIVQFHTLYRVQNRQKDSRKQKNIQRKPSKLSMFPQDQTTGTTTLAQNN